MKYKNIKKIGTVTVLTLLLIISVSLSQKSVLAQINSNQNDDCYDDWLAFSSSVISFEDFKEYWKDIFYRYNKNICHYMDIANIQKKMVSIREQMREAYYSCSYGIAMSLSKRYTEMEVEIYYLRNFISFPLSQPKKIAEEKIYKQMVNKFYITNPYFFDENEVKELFDKYNKKYENRFTAYQECQDPGLKALVAKWNSLVANLKATSEKMGEGIKARWNQSINTPIKRTGPITTGNTIERLDNLSPPKNVPEIQSEISEEGSTPTIHALQEAIVKHYEDNVIKKESALLMAEYETLYKKGGDNSTKELMNKLEEINKTITDTYPFFDSLEKCAKKTAERQCE